MREVPSQSRLNNSQKIAPVRSIELGLSTIPKHYTTEIVELSIPGTLDDRSDSSLIKVAFASALLAGGRPNVQLRSLSRSGAVTAQVPRPSFERVDEAGLADIAARLCVVVELDEDKVHVLHCCKRDGFIWPRTLSAAEM